MFFPPINSVSAAKVAAFEVEANEAGDDLVAVGDDLEAVTRLFLGGDVLLLLAWEEVAVDDAPGSGDDPLLLLP